MKKKTYRQCVSLPMELKKRMDAAKDKYNWSAIAAFAFEQALEGDSHKKSLEERIKRLEEKLK